VGWFRNHDKQQVNKPIAARTLRTMAETCDWATRIQASSPLSIMSVAGGPLLRVAGALFSIYIVVTDGTITARSGTTPGSGTVFTTTWNGSVLTTTTNTFTVYNISSTTGGIATGVYGVMVKIMGSYWLITLDCGN
jgi:hypothetical protein